MTDFTWQRMSADDYAALHLLQGSRVRKVGTSWWCRVRPFFYRPLIPFQEFSSNSVSLPVAARMGGCQYAVKSGDKANSWLNMLLFENPSAYSLYSLTPKKRKEVKIAEKEFCVRRVLDSSELCKAHAAYLSFYERTHYRYKSERRHFTQFAAWADSLFQNPQPLVLAAYRNGDIKAVCVSHLVETTLLYSTVFSDTDSLKLQVTRLLLHKVRETAAVTPRLDQIFAGLCKCGPDKGVDDFYLARGCSLVKKPAVLLLDPFTRLALTVFRPERYRTLRGDNLERQSPSEISESTSARV